MYRITAVCFAISLGFNPFVFGQNSPALVGDYTTPSPIYQMGSAFRAVNLSDLQVNPYDALLQDLQTSNRDRYGELIRPPAIDVTLSRGELSRPYSNESVTPPKEAASESQLRGRRLNRQDGGFKTFLGPDMQQRLNLTKEQRTELRNDIAWSERQMREINRVGATDPERADELSRNYQREYDVRLNKLLTQEQVREWRNVTGQRFEFPRPAMLAP